MTILSSPFSSRTTFRSSPRTSVPHSLVSRSLSHIKQCSKHNTWPISSWVQCLACLSRVTFFCCRVYISRIKLPLPTTFMTFPHSCLSMSALIQIFHTTVSSVLLHSCWVSWGSILSLHESTSFGPSWSHDFNSSTWNGFLQLPGLRSSLFCGYLHFSSDVFS